MVEQEITRSRTTSCNAGRDGCVERIVEQLLDQAENRFSLRDSGVAQRRCLPRAGRPVVGRTLIALDRATACSCWGVSVACQEPAAGAAASLNRLYGGPPWRSARVAATLHQARSAELSLGFSVTSMTRAERLPRRPRRRRANRPPRHSRAPSLAPTRSPPRAEGIRLQLRQRCRCSPE
jgi:hypothetical protein